MLSNQVHVTLSIIYWMIAILVCFLIGIFSLYKVYLRPNNEKTKIQKSNIATWAICFILIGVSIIFSLSWQYFIDDSLVLVFDMISMQIFHVAVLLKIIQTEYSINKHEFYKGYYFSFVIVAEIIYTQILTPPVIRSNIIYSIIYTVLGVGGVSIYPAVFIYIAYHLDGEERQKALRIILCPVLFVASFVFQPQNLNLQYSAALSYIVLIYILLLVPPLMLIIGIILMFTTYREIL